MRASSVVNRHWTGAPLALRRDAQAVTSRSTVSMSASRRFRYCADGPRAPARVAVPHAFPSRIAWPSRPCTPPDEPGHAGECTRPAPAPSRALSRVVFRRNTPHPPLPGFDGIFSTSAAPFRAIPFPRRAAAASRRPTSATSSASDTRAGPSSRWRSTAPRLPRPTPVNVWGCACVVSTCGPAPPARSADACRRHSHRAATRAPI